MNKHKGNNTLFLKPSHRLKFLKLLGSHECRWFNITAAEVLRSFALFCWEIDLSLLELWQKLLLPERSHVKTLGNHYPSVSLLALWILMVQVLCISVVLLPHAQPPCVLLSCWGW